MVDSDNQTIETVSSQDLSQVQDSKDLSDLQNLAQAADIDRPADVGTASVATTYRVIARGGLFMRGGPGTDFPGLAIAAVWNPGERLEA
jgi:hypothetical protein